MAGDPDDDAQANDAGVVDPNELDIEDDEHVKALGDNRYVVSPDDPITDETDTASVVDADGETAAGSDTAGERPSHDEPHPDDTEGGGGSGSGGDADGIGGGAVGVHRARARLTERMAETGGAYGFDATAQFGDEVVQQHLQANDIVTVFDALLLWYAEHLDDETPAEEAIGLLLAESDIPVEYPTDALVALVRTHGLDADDTVGELIDAACEETVQFPPR
jgi:hypothetical protein